MILNKKFGKKGNGPKILENKLPEYIKKLDNKTYKDLRTGKVFKMKEISFKDFFGFNSENNHDESN